MKKILVLLVCVILMGGCAYGKYKSPEGANLTYIRMGNQEVSGVDITAPENFNVKFDQQKSDNQALIQLIVEIMGRLP